MPNASKFASPHACFLMAVSATALFAFTPAVAQADDVAVETVVVTAQKRQQNVQDVPLSMTAISGEDIARAGISDLSELSRSVPSLIMNQQNNNRNTTVAIRGFGTSGTNPGIESDVGIFLDGVYMPAAGAVLANLLDISAIEVLRGPQGTLYGRNTPVGALNINTREPSFEPEAMVNVKFGNYSLRNVSGYVGGALSDTVAGRLSAWISDRDGYELNTQTGTDINDNHQFGFRGKMKWTPNENLDVGIIGYYSQVSGRCCYSDQINPTGPGGVATPGFLAASAAAGYPFTNLVDGDRRIQVSVIPDDTTHTIGVSATVNWRTPFGLDLISISAFNRFDDQISELAAVALPQPVVSAPQRLAIDTMSEELRLSSPTGQALEYVAGLYFFHDQRTYTNSIILLSAANRVFPGGATVRQNDTNSGRFSQNTNSFAAFGQATYHITDALSVLGGIRYSVDAKTASIVNSTTATSSPQFRTMFPSLTVLGLNREDKKVTWEAGAQYKIAEDIMAYAKFGTGFKDGGFNSRATSALFPIAFEPETTEAWEIGLKSQFFGRKLLVNIDYYHMLMNGFQDSTLNPVTGSGFIVGNAGNRRAQGFEADIEARPVDELTLNASLTFTDAVFTFYPSGQCPAMSSPGNAPVVVGASCRYTGLRPANNPKWQWSIGGQWQQPYGDSGFDWFVGMDLTHTGSQHLDTTLDVRSIQDAYTLFNARLGVESQEGTWRVQLWGRNLANESYYIAALSNALTAVISAGGTAAAGGYQGWYGPPRTYGIDLSYRF